MQDWIDESNDEMEVDHELRAMGQFWYEEMKHGSWEEDYIQRDMTPTDEYSTCIELSDKGWVKYHLFRRKMIETNEVEFIMPYHDSLVILDGAEYWTELESIIKNMFNTVGSGYKWHIDQNIKNLLFLPLKDKTEVMKESIHGNVFSSQPTSKVRIYRGKITIEVKGFKDKYQELWPMIWVSRILLTESQSSDTCTNCWLSRADTDISSDPQSTDSTAKCALSRADTVILSDSQPSKYSRNHGVSRWF